MLAFGAWKSLLSAGLRTQEEQEIPRGGKALFQQERAIQSISVGEWSPGKHPVRKMLLQDSPWPLYSTCVAVAACTSGWKA